ncbi:helix-turn-helix domain-containing protein [Luteithermobacter gelatinilyticus]|uniref:helix-turn-helix domain-containing protein n=1 Tax=Luteithermobacter gelatinilyticus TaxID=2582913 RepID=UPI00110659E8|nr:helix-turn-helix transcriptional regulator [Luteithermobacter gelatinilyticus]
MSFKINISGKRKVFANLLAELHEELYDIYQKRNEETGLTKADIAERLEVHRSLITKKFGGTSNLTLESVAYLAWALDCKPRVELIPLEDLNNNRKTYTEYYLSGSKEDKITRTTSTSSTTTFFNTVNLKRA